MRGKYVVNKKPNQMKSASSPTLSEIPPADDVCVDADILQGQRDHRCDDNDGDGNVTKTNGTPKTPAASSSATSTTSSGSVLQRLKNTISNFKTKTTTSTTAPTTTTPASVTISTGDPGKSRLSALVWRTNKERKKSTIRTSNSGDSAIQTESTLTNNINMENQPNDDTMSVRRVNSAKDTPIVNKENYLTVESSSPLPLTKRYFSQPAGLDGIPTRKESDITDEYISSCEDQFIKNPHSLVYAEVLYSFKALGDQELALHKGELVEVFKRDSGPWWWGRIKTDAIFADINKGAKRSGWFPKDFVRIVSSGSRIFTHSPTTTPSDLDIMPDLWDKKMKPKKLVKQNPIIGSDWFVYDTIQQNIIKELLDTELNYVNLLKSICDGFVKELRKRPDIFKPKSINIIFSNIEHISAFQQRFLNALQKGVQQNKVAETFLEHQYAFMIYSTYCNSYSSALMELENYTGNTESSTFLENCRIKENLPDLPLSAHLLVPIQRICKYPLHLGELVKHSPSRTELFHQYSTTNGNESFSMNDIETFDCKEMFEAALLAMKRVTETVNEGKRHSEYLSRIQARFENYQGPPLSVHSSRLFLQTDATRMTPTLWSTSYTLFLFDHQLIYCKRDLIKRSNYIYKGRIFLDNCRVLNLADGKFFGVTLKNTIRLYCDTRNKWFDFAFRNNSSKMRFLNTLSVERQFCGQNLFITELDGVDDEHLSDRENYSDYNEYIERRILSNKASSLLRLNDDGVSSSENVQQTDDPAGTHSMTPSASNVKIYKYLKKGETLPKKSRKFSSDATQATSAAAAATTTEQQMNLASQQTNSLGRRKFGYWVRRAKSTNSTPSHSPTHPMATSTTGYSIDQSKSSSQQQFDMNPDE